MENEPKVSFLNYLYSISCLGVFAIVGLIFVVIGLGSFYSLGELAYSEKIEPPYPSEVPTDVPLLEGRSKFEPIDVAFIAPYNHTLNGRIYFQSQKSINAEWRARSSSFLFTNPFSERIAAESRFKEWEDELVGDIKYFQPFIKLSFPIKREHNHRWIEGIAQVDLVYPERIREGSLLISGSFINKEVHLEHPLSIYVVSPDEYDMVKEYNQWKKFQFEREDRTSQIKYVIQGLIFMTFGILILRSLIKTWRGYKIQTRK
jgi:hypothetical protein